MSSSSSSSSSSSFRPKKKKKMSSSSSSSSSEAKWLFDVFLSFRGEDVRRGFLADLHRCLLHRGINAYIDSEDLRPGDQISPALTKAIEESRIAVLVFSENYASSRWCLDELVKVMECKRLKGQLVLPVFYRVEPREVRGQRESYGKALARHEEKLGKDSERVEKWRQALIEAGNLSGWHYDHGGGTKFIESIVKEISAIVGRVPLSVAKHPVGLRCRVEKVMSLLNMGFDDAQMIGIWGTGGVGKTTIAKGVYNRIASQFDGYSFLADVRETSGKPDGLVDLQKKLLSQILWKENLAVLSVDGGANLIRDILRCRKILLVLDDVDHGEQLNALARECEWFGKGSRIIITTRDKHVLASHGIDQVYEVEPLDQVEGCELLSSHAFPRNQTKDIHKDLIYKILGYANGLPLAIVVLGPLLCGRSREAWESILKNLAESPLTDINKVLKISFNALDNNHKGIFLDIACFFKGRESGYVTRVLDSYGPHPLFGIETLIERSLVTIDDMGIVQMHDLIQLMGQDIVKHECLDDPGKWSRLWCSHDVYEVLSAAMGTNAVKGIVLQLPSQEKLHISRDAFTRMRRLKLLILSNARISGGLVCLPDDLRWLEWHRCHLDTLEFSAGPKKLVCFDVSGSQIKKFRGYLKDFRTLKDINFSFCKFLTRVPDISSTPNLERLNLFACESLVEVDQSVGYLDKLEFLLLDSCSKLSIFPSILKTKSLRELGLAGCSNLKKFPDIMVKIECLEELDLQYTAIKELPASIDNLVSVRYINLGYCKNLIRLPSSIYKLQNLDSLDLMDCSNFIMFPKNLEDPTDLDGGLGFPNLGWLDLKGCNLSGLDFLEGYFPKLTHLYLSGNKFTHLPRCLNEFNNLEWLLLDNCQQLQEIPQLPSNIGIIRAQNCRSLQNLPDFSSLSNFSEVDFSSCCGLSRKEFDLAGVSILEYLRNAKREVEIILTGGEMPGWIHHCEEGSISFKVPDDLRDKVLGLALCVVIGLEEAKVVDVQLYVGTNGVEDGFCRFLSLESDNVWLKYSPWGKPCKGGDWQVRLRVSKGSIKQCGFRLICQQQEDDLRVKPQCPHPIETNWLLKEVQDEAKESVVHDGLDKQVEGMMDLLDLEVSDIEYLVGIDKQVEDMMDLLDLEVSDLRIVGIWGKGGVGKTTLARIIYKQISSRFDSCSFLADIETTTKQFGGVQFLQSKLLSDILKQEHEVDHVAKGVNFFKELLRNMKVLIILDDVEVQSHLCEIIGEKLDWFGYGSRIIVTTSDMSILPKFIPRGLALDYKINMMNNDQALELFRKHAQRRSPPVPGFDEAAKDIINSVNGIPLLIEVIGSLLDRKLVEKLIAIEEPILPFDLRIQEILQVGYEELSEVQREMLLDIACLPADVDCRIASFMWHNPHFPPSDGIEALRVKSLVKIGRNNELGMHRLLREFGQQIIRREDHLHPGRRGRLCNLSWNIEKMEGTEHLNFVAEDFKSMPNIRFLILDRANVDGDFANVFPNLKWLQWQGCTGDFKATNFHVEKLVILDLSWSKVTEDWGGWREIKMPQLKVLNLTGCADLLISPDLSSFTALEILILERCSQLMKLDPSIRHLKYLASLNLRFCNELSMLPIELSHLKALKELLIDGTSVQEIPVSMGYMEQLEIFSASNCLQLSHLPDSLCDLTALSVLLLENAKITRIPDSAGTLVKLRNLSLKDCRWIERLPDSIQKLKRLEQLDITGIGISKLPNSITCLRCLKVLKMDSCFIRELPREIGNLANLEELHASYCRSLKGAIPNAIKSLDHLRILKLGHSSISGLPSEIVSLSCLQTLDLLRCNKIQALPELPSSLTCLRVSSERMKALPDLKFMVKLEEICLGNTDPKELICASTWKKPRSRLTDPLAVGLPKLKILELSHSKISNLSFSQGSLSCTHLKKLVLSGVNLQEVSALPVSLSVLSIQRCFSLKGLPAVGNLRTLSEINLIQSAVEEIKGLEGLIALEVLNIAYCEIRNLNGLGQLSALRRLILSDCDSLDELPDISDLKMLNVLEVQRCKIHDIEGLKELTSLEVLHVSECEAEKTQQVQDALKRVMA